MKSSQVLASEGKEAAEVPKLLLIPPKERMLLIKIIFVLGFIT